MRLGISFSGVVFFCLLFLQKKKKSSSFFYSLVHRVKELILKSLCLFAAEMRYSFPQCKRLYFRFLPKLSCLSGLLVDLARDFHYPTRQSPKPADSMLGPSSHGPSRSF